MPEHSTNEFTVTVDGINLAGEYWAPETLAFAPPILLLHGGGQTRHSWDRSAAALAARGHDTFTVDLRGHGDSSWADDGDYGLDAFVRDLCGVLQTFDRPPILIGASLGGTTSLCVVGENRGIASALVMVDVVIDVERAGVGRIYEFMTAHLNGFASLEEVADAVSSYNPARKGRRSLDGLRKNVRRRDDGRWYWHWDPAFVLDSNDELRHHSDPERLAAAARRVTIPTLIVRGGRSDVVSEAGMEQMRVLVPHAQVSEVNEAGHMVAGDDNQVFAHAIDEFLSRNFSGATTQSS